MMISGKHGRRHEEHLEEYILLAKGASGSACAAVVKKALADPKVLVFGELLEIPKVVELAQSHPDIYRLLEIFAYGTYAEYQATLKEMALPELDEHMSRKLKTLTLVTLATTGSTSVLSYEYLSERLEIPTVRELEDHIIEAISNNIISGHLNQKDQHLHVDFVMGRDLRKGDLQRILLSLGQWSGRCQTMLAALDEKNNVATNAKKESIEYQQQVVQRIMDTKSQMKQDKKMNKKVQVESIFALMDDNTTNRFGGFPAHGIHGDTGGIMRMGYGGAGRKPRNRL